MIVLDAFAVVGFLRGEACAGEVEDLLGRDCVISALNLAEVMDQMVRVVGVPVEELDGDLATMPIRVITVTEELGVRAGRLKAEHHGSKTCAISMADCVAAATAASLNADLATSDPDLARVARAHGIPVVPLPDSRGVRP